MRERNGTERNGREKLKRLKEGKRKGQTKRVMIGKSYRRRFSGKWWLCCINKEEGGKNERNEKSVGFRFISVNAV